MADGKDTGGRMTAGGSRKAANFIHDLLRGRKDAVTFFIDDEGVLKELGTGKVIQVRYPQTKDSN